MGGVSIKTSDLLNAVWGRRVASSSDGPWGLGAEADGRVAGIVRNGCPRGAATTYPDGSLAQIREGCTERDGRDHGSESEWRRSGGEVFGGRESP